MNYNIIQGDCIEGMKQIPDESVHCVVTSPPYYGLRDYGVDGQIGLEETPEAYVERLVDVFREVRRILRKDGTVWLNLGDTYVSNPGDRNKVGGFQAKPEKARLSAESAMSFNKHGRGFKPKDLIGIPWRVAFALQADGWWLRQDIIWHKPNPMPESVTDRCTKSHEYIFLLTKSERYYYDAEAIKEQGVMVLGDSTGSNQRDTQETHGLGGGNSGINKAKQKLAQELREKGYSTRNKRSVWTVNTQPYPEAHFAVYPIKLIEPCILAGSPVGGVVFDPFTGSGTTAFVALTHNRRFVGTELNPEYVKLAEKRLSTVQFRLLND